MTKYGMDFITITTINNRAALLDILLLNEGAHRRVVLRGFVLRAFVLSEDNGNQSMGLRIRIRKDSGTQHASLVIRIPKDEISLFYEDKNNFAWQT